MDWGTIASAVLAGGLAGQLATLFGGSWLTLKRENKRWRISERYKLFSDLMTVATFTPKDQVDLDKWTYRIRDSPQRIHILYEGGTAPESLADSIEQVFQMARVAKHGNAPSDWSENMRNSVRAMRQEMAKHLYSD